LPIDAIKIDRSFVQGLHERRDDAAICAAILAMAHELSLKVIAEGVELDEQVDFLRSHGCDFAQGFLIGRPMPAEELQRVFGDARRLRSRA
jgi:EAL domain-containing protein (putative c-di-GMP-specific phosphodiesterase class I)